MAVRIGSRSRAGAVARDTSVPVVTRAEAMAERGKYRDAIELLEVANRTDPDPAAERLLVQLRFDGIGRIGRVRRPPPWPPEVPDLFPDVVAGPPEITGDRLDAQTLHSAILHHGSLLVRGLVSRERVDQLVDDIDRTFVAHDAWLAGDAGPTESPWFTPVDAIGENRRFIRETAAVMAVESPRSFTHVTEIFDDLGMRELAREYFGGEEPLLLAQKWALRRVEPDADPADWHQDGAFMGAEVRSLDVWVALSECGREAPGLDLVGRRLDGIVPTGTDDAQLDWTVGRGMVAEVAEGTVVNPDFHPGDTLFFDQFCLHRTGTVPGLTRRRYALEAWFAAPSSYPPKQLPILY